jgi:hypothetical protein
MRKPTAKRLRYLCLMLLAFVALSIVTLFCLAGYDTYRPVEKPNNVPGLMLGRMDGLKKQTLYVDERTTISVKPETMRTSSTMPLADERILAVIDEHAFHSAEMNVRARAWNKKYDAVMESAQTFGSEYRAGFPWTASRAGGLGGPL